MKHTNSISHIIHTQKKFFASHTTLNIQFRITQLTKLKQLVTQHEQALYNALYTDFKKPPFETYITEIHIIQQEINYALKRLHRWCKPQHITHTSAIFPGYGYLQAQPVGVVLIIAPWNYPLQLTLVPLIGAIAAGNCAIIKPSELTPQTATLVDQLIHETFDPAYITVIQGDANRAQELLSHQFDYIFFTGSSAIGKIVMQKAAQHLTPVTLELGGKNPCIVDCDVSIPCAARRITWGKFLNAGQSCVAPDYVLVHATIKDDFIKNLNHWINKFYGENPAYSTDYGRIINHAHFDRLINLLATHKIIIGGEHDRDNLYIAPTVIEPIDPISTTSNNITMPNLHEEIFGPILPIITYQTKDQLLDYINQQPKPLALYLFCNNKQTQQRFIQQSISGSIVINDLVLQAGSPKLSFGGVGMSGMGAYHGKKSFDTFSHYKTIVKARCWFDMGLRYPPYHSYLKKMAKAILTWLK